MEDKEKINLVRKYLPMLIVAALPFIGNKVWDLIQTGGEVEINNAIDARFTENMTNPVYVRMFLEQPDIQNFAKEQREEAKLEAAKEDAESVNFETQVSEQMGVFPTIAPAEIGKMYKEWKSGTFYCKRNSITLSPM